MSKPVQDQINYWPGYVDALVNVVLNLLFLVGVFTIGLVSLNMEAIFTQEKIARLNIERLFEGELNAERQQRALALLAERSNQPIPRSVTETTVTEPVIHEVHLKASSEPTPTRNSSPQYTPEQIALSLSGGTEVLAKFTFEKNQFNLPESNPVMAQLSENNKAHKVLLLVVTDTTNPRLAHEAYTRLVAVRSAMLRHGLDQKNITLRALSNATAPSRPTDIDLSVFAVRISQ